MPDAAGVMAFEQKALAADGVDFPPVPPRYRTPYFRHILAGDDAYDAGYYAYIWSEVLDANSRDWFRQHGGATRANGPAFPRYRCCRAAAAWMPCSCSRTSPATSPASNRCWKSAD